SDQGLFFPTRQASPQMKLRQRLIVSFSIFTALFLVSVAAFGQEGGYYVPTNLAEITDVSEVTDVVQNPSVNFYKTIRARCQESVAENSEATEKQFQQLCCQPPDYWLNPQCPLQQVGQDLPYAPSREFGTQEEQDAYQSVISCLQNDGSDESCIRNDTLNGIGQAIEQEKDACVKPCEGVLQSCNEGCVDPGWTTPERYQAYLGWIDCELQQLNGWFDECQEAQVRYTEIMGGYNSALRQQAYKDFFNYNSSGGTSLQPAPVATTDTACQNDCLREQSVCEDPCNTVNNQRGSQADVAAHQALDDWKNRNNTISNTAPTNVANAETGPLARKLAAFKKAATPVAPTSTVDASGTTIAPEKLAQGLGDAQPSVRLGFGLNNIKTDELVSLEIQPGLPIAAMVLTPAQPIDDGVIAVTMIDGAKLQFQGVPPPEPTRYELKDYFQVGTTVGQAEAHPWKEALFEFLLPLVPNQNYENAEMLRWNQDQNEWDTLPVEQIGCGSATCRFIASSSGTSYFAIVVKKDTSSYAVAGVLFWGGLVFLGIWLIRRRKKRKAIIKALQGKDLHN
ncbi:MAG TPA: hypothetical protein DIS62_04890, partial [Candidatus Kerfeldbacteria bacterium]|nr:hypothetical protein [Candidatus Kerfeldbacteria bacterium]